MSRELETFLRRYPELVLVNFWQEGCDASRYMAQMLAGLEHFQQVSVLHLKLAEHRPWARDHGVFGTPALVVYYRKRALFRIIGRVTPEELLRRFRELDVGSFPRNM